jgi:peptidoglycan/LPS O-acetylase OafA/YrhL
MKTKRPKILITTSFLLILSTLLIWGIVLLVISDGGDPGWVITVSVGVILGVLSLVVAAGVFVVKRWGMWLAVVVSVFGIVFAIGGVVLSDPSLKKGLCVVLAALYVLVIVLVVLPSARQSSVTERVREAS